MAIVKKKTKRMTNVKKRERKKRLEQVNAVWEDFVAPAPTNWSDPSKPGAASIRVRYCPFCNLRCTTTFATHMKGHGAPSDYTLRSKVKEKRHRVPSKYKLRPEVKEKGHGASSNSTLRSEVEEKVLEDCPYCNKSFVRLLTHIARSHQEERAEFAQVEHDDEHDSRNRRALAGTSRVERPHRATQSYEPTEDDITEWKVQYVQRRGDAYNDGCTVVADVLARNAGVDNLLKADGPTFERLL